MPAPKVRRPRIQCIECGEREARGPFVERCARCQRREYVRTNPEKVKAQKKLHYRKHAARLKVKSNENYHRNSERLNEAKRQARIVEPERFSLYARVRYVKHQETIKAAARNYYLRNPDVAKAANGRRRALLKNSTVGVVDLPLVRQRSEGVCGICRKTINDNDPVHFDHIIPLSKGGAHSNDNLQLAHALCNRRKKDRLNFSL